MILINPELLIELGQLRAAKEDYSRVVHRINQIINEPWYKPFKILRIKISLQNRGVK